MLINNEGSVVQFTPEGDFEYEWLTLNTDAAPYQWLGRSLVVDHHMAGDLLAAVQSEGFVSGGSHVAGGRRG